jgi:hypothetical protein
MAGLLRGSGRTRARARAAVGAVVVGGTLVTSLVATPSGPAGAVPGRPTQEAPADGFTVEPLPDGGYRVELQLAEPLPVRDAVLP